MSTAESGFLPKGYEAPDAGGNYMKFDSGDNKFRILSKPLIGWEYWNLENKPVRIEGVDKPAVDPILIKADQQGNKPIKHFWAFVVYNYKTKAIQILQITQSRVQKGIQALAASPDWGSPFKYDITVTKSGAQLLTKYAVVPSPPAEASNEVKEAYKAKSPINVKALLANGDPFAGAVKAAPVAPVPPVPPVKADVEEELPF